MYRKVEKSDFEGKTTRKVDARACNQLTLHFQDGTQLVLETYRVQAGLYALGVWEADKLVEALQQSEEKKA